jgi:DNA-binding LytR/AlgR family response regulator
MPQITYTAIIAEDEPNLLNYLSNLIEQNCHNIKIISKAKNGIEAIEKIKKYQPDLVFLDIRMPGLSGIEVAKKIQGISNVIFTTAYDDFAIKAFDLNATDYLLKPIQPDRLKEAINKITNTTKTENKNKAYQKWLKVGYGKQIKVLKINDISYFYAENKYTSVFYQDKIYLITMSLKKLENTLNPDVFVQIHRNAIINLAQIDKIELKNMFLFLKNKKEPLKISRTYQGFLEKY